MQSRRGLVVDHASVFDREVGAAAAPAAESLCFASAAGDGGQLQCHLLRSTSSFLIDTPLDTQCSVPWSGRNSRSKPPATKPPPLRSWPDQRQPRLHVWSNLCGRK